jgi:hypothetical protein
MEERIVASRTNLPRTSAGRRGPTLGRWFGRYTVVLLPLLVCTGMLALACGSREAEQGATENEQAESDTTRTPRAATEGRDLSGLDVCALVPGEEVAGLLGGTLGGDPRSRVYPGASTECSYAIEGEGPTEFVLVFLYPPSHFELFATDAEDRQDIDGLGDRAYATTIGGLHQVYVLVEGDVTVDARAGTIDEARRLAELVLSKL